MTTIYLVTELEADIYTCFDAARAIDIHKLSTKQTNEIAIAGRTSGLCELGDTITWEATHFGIRQQLTVEITQLNRPYFFEDKMLKSAFKSMQHSHFFEEKDTKTIMTDKFEYEVPYSIAGKIFDAIILKHYMTSFLITRNQFIKSTVEVKRV
jgi:ligand-binding SRPBCC domain-containing protein